MLGRPFLSFGHLNRAGVENSLNAGVPPVSRRPQLFRFVTDRLAAGHATCCANAGRGKPRGTAGGNGLERSTYIMGPESPAGAAGRDTLDG
jgi:hypothetical protein